MVRASARFKHDFRCLLFGEEAFHPRALEFAPKHRVLLFIDTVQREDVLGRVDRDALKLHLDGPLLEDNNPTLAPDAVGPSTPTVVPTDDWYARRVGVAAAREINEIPCVDGP